MRFIAVLVWTLAISGIGPIASGATHAPFPETYPREFSDAKCAHPLAQLLSGWKVQPDWYLTVGSADGYRVYRAPTDRAGSWAEVALFPDRSARAARVSWSTRTEVRYDADGTCQPRVSARASVEAHRIPAQALSDEGVQTAIQDDRGTLIYAWSPHMPYSVVGLERARKAAERMKIGFLPVLDAAARQKDVDRLVKEGKVRGDSVRRMYSLDLGLRGMDIHFPSIVMARSGRFVGHILPGLKSESEYSTFARRELAAAR